MAFRVAVLLLLVSAISLSGFCRVRAARGGTIERAAEGRVALFARMAVALPLLALILGYVFSPGWLEWSRVVLPPEVRVGGLLLGLVGLLGSAWTLVSIGSNISPTVLTRSGQELVTRGPYRWIRHPLYTSGLLLLLAICVMAENALMLCWVAIGAALLLLVVIPREERELIARFGPEYEAYRKRTGALIPRMKLAAAALLVFVAACDTPTQPDTTSTGTDLATVDAVMTAFMEKYSVPGLSLAITKDERLVYLKAYGRADDGPLSTSDRFRLASVSKPITSVAIMRLVEQGRLSLDQRVFGAGGVLGTTYGTQPYGAGVTSITVDHLLHHTAGGWPNSAGDPMFANPWMPIEQLISWALDNRPLTSTPGSAYAYSNFGYVVLGRVIERVTGEPYADAVKTLVLRPAGITDMAIAGNTLAERQADEVMYFRQGGEDPYAINVSRSDAAGGWIASARSLAKLLVHVDGFEGRPDILASATIATMTTGSSANPGYAAGWLVNRFESGNWWHNGGMAGTGTEIARTVSGGNYNFVILTNTMNPAPTYFPDLDRLFWAALAATPSWPDIDLFEVP